MCCSIYGIDGGSRPSCQPVARRKWDQEATVSRARRRWVWFASVSVILIQILSRACKCYICMLHLLFAGRHVYPSGCSEGSWPHIHRTFLISTLIQILFDRNRWLDKRLYETRWLFCFNSSSLRRERHWTSCWLIFVWQGEVYLQPAALPSSSERQRWLKQGRACKYM